MSKETKTTEWAMILANRLAEVISKVGEAVLLLVDKRVTLEEKMIRRYFHELASIAARSACVIHQLTRDGASCSDDILGALDNLTAETADSLAEFLKMARYDLNFLEQYFEKEFYDNLINEHKFIERFCEIEQKLSACRPNNQ